ncbi:MAG: RagB/SusD family nutrient uptake outer membrane protein [Odoribacter sp.]|nr:RagB/SusD family nutrient uptake outer membrane protein [Odoribacter sp.]
MKNLLFILIIAISAGSCGFLDEYSQDLVVAKSVSDFDEVLLGDVYMDSKKEVRELLNGDCGWWLHILDDDVTSPMVEMLVRDARCMRGTYYGYYAWQMEVGRNYDGSGMEADDQLWSDFYKRINICNIILDEIDNVEIPESDEADALRVKGEAHFLRAYYYFYLANIYADAYQPSKAAQTLGVPYKLTSYVEHDKDKDTQFERAPLDKVYAGIVSDLRKSVDYLTRSPQTHSFYRVSKEAAQLFLSRVYLFMQDWQNAALAAEAVLETKSALKNYAGVGEKDLVIDRNNPEILFSQGSLNVQNCFAGDGGDFCISSELYEMYDDADYRKALFFRENGGVFALNRKYQRGLHQSYVSDLYLLRISEAYLNAAEARAMLGDNVAASEWLSRFRFYRIDGWQKVVYDPVAVIDEVRNERRKEFCLEGHRWFDLRRYAVCSQAPMQKEIEHVLVLFADKHFRFEQAEVYRLEKNDPAYTFAIPRSVLEFDTGMPNNVRPSRNYVSLLLELESDPKN